MLDLLALQKAVWTTPSGQAAMVPVVDVMANLSVAVVHVPSRTFAEGLSFTEGYADHQLVDTSMTRGAWTK